MKFSKRGISPLIATVLLIGFTIVLAALVMRWGGTLFRETTQTTGCESQGRIACSSQVDISVGTIDCTNAFSTKDTCDYIDSIIVNNLAATQTLDGFNVQRENVDGSIENIPFPVSGGLAAGKSTTIGPIDPTIGGGGYVALHVTPTFTQTTTDGESCKIVCQEQKERIPKGDPRIT